MSSNPLTPSPPQDVHCFNDANIFKQLESAQFTLGYYTLRFHTENGKPVNRATGTISEFYLYPSGGTLRDEKFNLVFYDSRFDTYRGFVPPHLMRGASPSGDVMRDHLHRIQEHVRLAPLTTIGLGGAARYYAECGTDDDLRATLNFARSKNLPVQILGSGSNTIFADEGFGGVVIHIGSRGITLEAEGKHTIATVAAGEPWDNFVGAAVDAGLAGLECLTGIPGTVGATPIQNVGAYGQDVSRVIIDVTTVNRNDGKCVVFSGKECAFSYRQSRFKSRDLNRYIITMVRFRLVTDGVPEVRYPDLHRFFEQQGEPAWRIPGTRGLSAVRAAVMAIRRKKSMVTDPADPNTKSVGSFFMNPVVTPGQFLEVQSRYRSTGGAGRVPSFAIADAVKVPAAWLVEHAGFPRGYRVGNVGISQNHALALINCGGTTRELLDLAQRIEEGVFSAFGIMLEREPVIVSP